MKVLEPGHGYELDVIDGDGKAELWFVKRTGENYPGNEEPPHSGVVCQEVLRALIDRCKYLNNQLPCVETQSVIHLLRTAMFMFEQRAAKRHDIHLELIHLTDIENIKVCPICGHIVCAEKHYVAPSS